MIRGQTARIGIRWTRCLLTAICASVVAFASTSAQPRTDIFVMEMPGELAEVHLSASNLTNRPAYNDQPSFSRDGSELWFTSIWDDGQSDIYGIDLRSGVQRRMTFSMDSEYSAAPMPDGRGFSVVRVEADGQQRLWRLSMDGRRSEPLLPDLDPVGYYTWLASDHVAVFLVGEPHLLIASDLQGTSRETVAMDIGRSLQSVPGRNAISYVQKGLEHWAIEAYDFSTGNVETIVKTLPGQEDFAWTPGGALLSADLDVIYIWTGSSDEWEVLVDFHLSPTIGRISRIAVSPDGSMIAFVAERPRSD